MIYPQSMLCLILALKYLSLIFLSSIFIRLNLKIPKCQ
jgi:hypothetical protein